MEVQRRDDAAGFVERVTAWAAGRPDVAALAVVGSHAREAARADSDLDVVLLTRDVASYVESDGWARELGAVSSVSTRSWGIVTARKFSLERGLEIDIVLSSPDWASTAPVDPGTQRVVGAGLRVLHDPDGLLDAVARACRG